MKLWHQDQECRRNQNEEEAIARISTLARHMGLRDPQGIGFGKIPSS